MADWIRQGAGLSVSEQFDLEQYRRERAARLERENRMLRRELDRAIRMLAVACRYASHGTADDPLALVRAFEEVDRSEQLDARIFELMRETPAERKLSAARAAA